MKISEVMLPQIKEYARVENSDDDNILSIIIESAKAYIQNYTGLTYDDLDTKEELTLALMVLCNEMYDNRVFTVQDNKINIVVKSILDMHSINFL